MEDANYIIMTKLASDESDFDKMSKKFVDVIATVLDTDVAKNEVKTLDTSSDGSSEDGEGGEEEAAAPSSVILLVKVTTK